MPKKKISITTNNGLVSNSTIEFELEVNPLDDEQIITIEAVEHAIDLGLLDVEISDMD